MIFSIYLYPSQYQKDEVSLSSSFTMVLRDIASVTTASNGKFVKDAPIEIRELLYKVVNNQITDNLFSITKKTIIK